MRRDSGISVARPTALGNPFVVDRPYTRAEAISRYRAWFADQVNAKNRPVMEQLAKIEAAARECDVTLLCHCAPLPCHAEVIVEYLEARLAVEAKGGLPLER